jgi:hypothetical protein
VCVRGTALTAHAEQPERRIQLHQATGAQIRLADQVYQQMQREYKAIGKSEGRNIDEKREKLGLLTRKKARLNLVGSLLSLSVILYSMAIGKLVFVEKTGLSAYRCDSDECLAFEKTLSRRNKNVPSSRIC